MTAEERLLNIIPHGEANAVSQSEITALTGFTPRDTRLIVERLRKQGVVICGSNAGRFIPETTDELKLYVKRTQSRIHTEKECLKSAINRLKNESEMI